MTHELPKVKTFKMQPRPKNPWWRRGSTKCSMRHVAYAGKYHHNHAFGAWEVETVRDQGEWFLYERSGCVYDGCGQDRVRNTKKRYCSHCGSLKETKR